MTRTRLGQSAMRAAAILAAYAVAAIATTWPIAAHLSTHLLAHADDTPLHYWNCWWVQQALSEWRSPYHAPYIFYPQGVSLVTHNIAWFNALLWSVLEPVIGGVSAYNLALIVNLALCGCAAYALVRYLSGNGVAAFVAGFIYQTWPYRMAQLDHPNLVSTQFIPLFLLFLIRTLRNGSKRDAVLCGVCFALVGYARWQQLIPAALMGGIVLLFALPKRARERPLPWRRLVASALIAIVALTPPAILLYEQQTSESAANLMREGEEERMQTDVLAYLTPSARHWLLHDDTERLYDNYYDDIVSDRRYPAYIGLTTAALAVLGILAQKRRSLVWVCIAGLMIALALGPVLRVNGQVYSDVAMPYRLLARTFVIRLMRAPTRYSMFLALPVSALAGYGVALCVGRLRHKNWAPAVGAVLSALVLCEYLAIPIPLHTVDTTSPFYDELARDREEYAILNLPIDPLRAKVYMWDQITHGHRIVQGNVSRVPGDAYAYIDASPLLRSLRNSDEIDPALRDVTAELRRLAQDDIRYIIIHKNLVGADRVAHWRRYLVAHPVYEDDEIVVYDTSPRANEDFGIQEELAPGIGIVALNVGNDVCLANSVLELDIAWGTTSDIGLAYDIVLSLIDENGTVWRPRTYTIRGGDTTDTWSANSLVWGYYPLSLPAYLPDGAYTLQVALARANTDIMVTAPQPIHSIQIGGSTTQLPADDTTAVFGREMRLRAVDLAEQDGSLECRLEWDALQHMEVDYKVFVHVYDLATGVPVAQDDAMPRRWAYPTHYWWPGEVIEDSFEIALHDVPAGTYGIAVGVYNSFTGVRLEARDGFGIRLPDGRYVATETFTVH